VIGCRYLYLRMLGEHNIIYIMDYDFLEIGCCDNNTLLDIFPLNSKGILVDPIHEHLEKLPSSDNIIKICCSISDNSNFKEVFFISEKNLIKHNLPIGLKNVSSILGVPKIISDLDQGHLVEKRIVTNYNIESFYKKYNINSVKVLKIDAEGCDLQIMEDLYNYIINKKFYLWPEKIIFECFYEQFRDEEKLKNIIFKFCIKNKFYNYNPIVKYDQENLIFYKNNNIFTYEYH